MREEYLPAEYRVSPKERSVFASFKRTSWNYKISFLLLLIGILINIAFIASIPIQVENSEYYYLVTKWQIGYEEVPYPLSSGPYPLFALIFDFTTNFHIQYWIMIALYSFVSFGVLLQSKDEINKLIRVYYRLMLIIFITGLVRLIILFSCMRYHLGGVYFGAHRSHLILTVFLMIYPIIFLTPMHYFIRRVILPRNPSENKLNKKEILLQIPFQLFYVALTGLLYIVVEIMI